VPPLNEKLAHIERRRRLAQALYQRKSAGMPID
jgi:hypothetical protein